MPVTRVSRQVSTVASGVIVSVNSGSLMTTSASRCGLSTTPCCVRLFVDLKDGGGAGVGAGDVGRRQHDLRQARPRHEAVAEHGAHRHVVGRRHRDALGDVHRAAAAEADHQVAAGGAQELDGLVDQSDGRVGEDAPVHDERDAGLLQRADRRRHVPAIHHGLLGDDQHLGAAEAPRPRRPDRRRRRSRTRTCPATGTPDREAPRSSCLPSAPAPGPASLPVFPYGTVALVTSDKGGPRRMPRASRLLQPGRSRRRRLPAARRRLTTDS